MSATIDGDNIIFNALVPKNTWFGLGFGHSGVKQMIETDIIFMNANWTENTDDPTKSVYGAVKDLYASKKELPGDYEEQISKGVATKKDDATTLFVVTRPLKAPKGNFTLLEKDKNYTFVYALNSKGSLAQHDYAGQW